jgi:hypothetical protein
MADTHRSAGRRPGFIAMVSAVTVFIVTVIVTVTSNFAENDILVWLSSLFMSGEIGGQWEIHTKEYPRDISNPTKLVPVILFGTLRQLGQRVTADISTTEHKIRGWKAEGYYNRPTFSLAYVTTSAGGSGLGTFALRESAEGNAAFLGFTTGVECKGTIQVLLTCPALFVRSDHGELMAKYATHLEKPCNEVPLDRICSSTPK